MAFRQHVMSCKDAVTLGVAAADHPQGRDNCICIIGEEDGVVFWHSHDDAAIDPATRVNADIPLTFDWRSP